MNQIVLRVVYNNLKKDTEEQKIEKAGPFLFFDEVVNSAKLPAPWEFRFYIPSSTR